MSTSFLAIRVPKGEGDLVRVETLPVSIEPNSDFVELKLAMEVLVRESKSLANSIQTDEDYNRASEMLKELKVLVKNLEQGVEPTKKLLNQAKNRIQELIHEIDHPVNQVLMDLSREHGRYKFAKDEAIRKENERLQREAELKRQREQHEADIEKLRGEIIVARTAADEANARGQKPTATEILNEIAGIETSLKTFNSVQNPIQTATSVRQIVALALQHEQARIAAAQARADGDAKTAKAILDASKKLEAPEVEEVEQERVEVQPTVQLATNLKHVAGASVGMVWRVKKVSVGAGKEKTVGITDPQRICREHPELCEPSESKLNDYAKRLKEKPNVGGVVWEHVIATKGVRA